jgi:Protein of unknown function (DUF2631)
VALEQGSEEKDLSLPADYHADHPNEHPDDWGWHGEWGRAARVAGWVVAIILLVMITATHYNAAGTGTLIFFAALIVVLLIRDRQHRKNSWRS